MLTIISGNIEKVKAELKQVLKRKTDDEKSLKRHLKQWISDEKKKAKAENRYEEDPPEVFEEKLEELGKLKNFYSKVVPVRVDSIIIDYACFQKAMKKLEGFNLFAEVKDNQLTVKYKKNQSKGSLHLYDISSYFSDFQHIPVGAPEDEES